MQKIFLKIIIFIIIALVLLVILNWGLIRGVLPLIKPIPSAGEPVAISTPTGAGNLTGIPLTLPKGFSISVFAKDLPGARVIAFDSFGNMWVSQPSEGAISSLQLQDGRVVNQNQVFKNLNKPHGLAFDPNGHDLLYIAEENKISKVTIYSEDKLHKIADLPAGGGHSTRTIGFGPDKRLYVAIGSSCNVCHEANDKRAKIFSMNADGTEQKEFARGLRNTVFFVWDSMGKMWGNDMGRDLLGDDVPPDELNVLQEGKNYGWPNCYGKNIHDTDFDKNTYFRNPCMDPFETESAIDYPAHSAPLGLAFVANQSWPADYRGNLIVAFHGSWNRSVPDGYKLVRVTFDAKGNYIGMEDFITGWLGRGTVYGRPVDLVFDSDGVLYLSDDRAGVIYKIGYTPL